MSHYYKLLFIYYSSFPKGSNSSFVFLFVRLQIAVKSLKRMAALERLIFTHMQSNIINQLHVRILIVVDLTAVK